MVTLRRNQEFDFEVNYRIFNLGEKTYAVEREPEYSKAGLEKPITLYRLAHTASNLVEAQRISKKGERVKVLDSLRNGVPFNPSNESSLTEFLGDYEKRVSRFSGN
ncbi:MAG TPA: hypothetical protein VJI68_02505 [Candidatus Nanoarchaeia archaeon]|nr:hypothetical protein [Candidatus Nanoarchaeia archaeon]